MAAHLTDKQKKKIIADYVQIGSYNAVAKINGVSPNTVKNIITSEENADFAKNCKKKKEENTADMLSYMDEKKDKAQKIIDVYLDKLLSEEKLETASLSQIATALGIIIDKFTKNTASGNDSLNKLDGLLKEFHDAIKSEAD